MLLTLHNLRFEFYITHTHLEIIYLRFEISWDVLYIGTFEKYNITSSRFEDVFHTFTNDIFTFIRRPAFKTERMYHYFSRSTMAQNSEKMAKTP